MSQIPSDADAGSKFRVPANLVIGSSQSGAMAAGRMAFSLVALQLAAAPWQVGILLALMSLFPALFIVQLGRWMDRVGTFRITVTAVSAALLAWLLAAGAPVIASFWVAAPFIGVSAVVAHVSSIRALGTDDDLSIRARNLGYLGACYALTHFVAPLSSGLMLDHFGASAMFLMLGIMPLGALAVLLLSDRRTVAPVPPRGAAVGENSNIMTLLRMPSLRRWLVANGVFATALTIFPFVASLHADQIGLSAAMTGWLIGAAAIGTVVIRTVTRKLVASYSPALLLAGALFATGAAYAVFAFVADIYGLVAISFVLGIAVGLGMPVVTTMIYTEAPSDRVSESLGLGTSLSMALQTIVPLIIGVITSLLGVKAMVCVLGLALALAAWESWRESRAIMASSSERPGS